MVAGDSPACLYPQCCFHQNECNKTWKTSSARLTTWILPIRRSSERLQAGIGEAQIRATVTAKSCRGQVRKHYIWYGLARDRARLNTQCSNRPEIGWGNNEGGENRESQITVSQSRDEGNGWIQRKRVRRDLSQHVRFPRSPSLLGSCRLLLAQLLEEQADRLDTAIEIRDVELFVGGVQIVVG